MHVHVTFDFSSARCFKNSCGKNVLGSTNLNAKLLRWRLKLILKYTLKTNHLVHFEERSGKLNDPNVKVYFVWAGVMGILLSVWP